MAENNLSRSKEIFESFLKKDKDDVLLSDLCDIFTYLNVPECFISDIKQCITYYYELSLTSNLKTDHHNYKKKILLKFLQDFTITNESETLESTLDIVDIEKFISKTIKLLQFRDNYSFIFENWKLFVDAVTDDKEKSNEFYCSYKLKFNDLEKIDNSLKVTDKSKNSYLLLKNMLELSVTDIDDNLLTYDFEKIRLNNFIGIKNFSEILENLDELEK